MSDEPTFVVGYDVLRGTAIGVTEEGGVHLPMLGIVLHTANDGDHVFAAPPYLMHDLARDVRGAYDSIEWPSDLAPPTRRWWLRPTSIMFLIPLPFAIMFGVDIGIEGVTATHPGVWPGVINAWNLYWQIIGMTSALTLAVLPALVRALARRVDRRAQRRAGELDGSHEAL